MAQRLRIREADPSRGSAWNLRNASSRAQAIIRRLAAALALNGYTTVEVRTPPDVIQ